MLRDQPNQKHAAKELDTQITTLKRTHADLKDMGETAVQAELNRLEKQRAARKNREQKLPGVDDDDGAGIAPVVSDGMVQLNSLVMQKENLAKEIEGIDAWLKKPTMSS